jgi:hypothetical protein
MSVAPAGSPRNADPEQRPAVAISAGPSRCRHECAGRQIPTKGQNVVRAILRRFDRSTLRSATDTAGEHFSSAVGRFESIQSATKVAIAERVDWWGHEFGG